MRPDETASDECEVFDGPMTADERAELERYGYGRRERPQAGTPASRSTYQPQRFFALADRNGDPTHERFNDDELRMLGPILHAQYAHAEPPLSILDTLYTRGGNPARIYQTVLEYCMYKGWLTLGTEAARRAQYTSTLALWAGYLDEEQRTEEAQALRAAMAGLTSETMQRESAGGAARILGTQQPA